MKTTKPEHALMRPLVKCLVLLDGIGVIEFDVIEEILKDPMLSDEECFQTLTNYLTYIDSTIENVQENGQNIHIELNDETNSERL